MSQIKNISILGSTGSIGIQTLEVIENSKGIFNLKYLTANKNIDLLEEQVAKFKPENVVIKDEKLYHDFKQRSNYSGNILCGDDGLITAASDASVDIVISALVGFAGVKPTIKALENGKTVALANKETLVSAGKPIMETAKMNNAEIIAVDSEHNAILQCLVGEEMHEVEKLILTASGGPFRETPHHAFHNLTVEQALNHPNWSMGSKITIDSATMMNKGFEVIEAFWLFGLPYEKIEVLVHPQSIVHSMVQFSDGSIKAQLGLPDMRTPISYALSYPRRFVNNFPRLDLSQLRTLEFYKPDKDKFKCLQLAYDSIEMGGTSTAALNAANEIAVAEFLIEKIRFIDIPQVILLTLENIENINNPSIDDIIYIDDEARKLSQKICNSLIK